MALREFAEAGRESSDNELIERATKGDERAFEALYLRYYSEAIRVAKSQLKELADDAEDVVNDAFIGAMDFIKKRPADVPRDFRAWVLVIVKNKAIDKVRSRFGYNQQRRGKERSLDDGEGIDKGFRDSVLVEDLTPEKIATDVDLSRKIEKAIDKLPKMRQALVLRMHYFEDFTMEEIGKRLDPPVTGSGAAHILVEARNNLRKILEKDLGGAEELAA